MGKVAAGITISVDGYITGPNDGPGCGLGVGGERLHYWVFGGPWRYDSPERGEPAGEDKIWLEEALGANGAVIAGRGTYEAAGHWGDKNPWGIPVFIVTNRPPSDDYVDELKTFTRERLSQHEFPRQVAFVSEIPKTPAGKVNRKVLRDREAAAAIHN